MSHWSAKYYGMPWTKDFDCAKFCELVYKIEFGLNLILPQHSENVSVSEQFSSKYECDMAEISDAPVEGDIVLMANIGFLHLGILFSITEPYVIHNRKPCGVIAERLSNLHVLGFYRWKHNEK